MNHRNFILLFGVGAFVMGLSACNDDESVLEPANLDSLDNEIIVNRNAGTYDLEVYTNGTYHVEVIDEVDWLEIAPGDPVNNVAIVGLKYEANPDFSRKMRFVVLSDADQTLCDTILFKQRAGKEPILSIDNSSLIQLSQDGGEYGIPITTNIPIELMTIETEYMDEGIEEWVLGLDIVAGEDDSEDRTLVVSFTQNVNVSPRSVNFKFSFDDDWDIGTASADVSMMQANKDGGLFTSITFEDMRNNYATGEPITDYVGVSGIVVSNKEQGNAGQPIHTTAQNQTDFSLLGRTVYLESEDAKYGIVIICDEEDDNIFDQFDRVVITLNGATLTKKFDTEDRSDYCPVNYELTGFKPSMVFSQVAGEDAPVKERTIATLTDDDMYTYVKLKDVEFPIRIGCIFNGDGGFTSCSTASPALTKYPTVVRDKDGNSLFMMTNDHCLYHRDGTRLPYGSGSISGVIVHEHFSRFEWEAGYSSINSDIEACETKGSLGNIGKYQIRHQTRGDVYDGMSTDFDDGFSRLICEYRYRVVEKTTGDLMSLGDSLDVPSYGTNGWFTHTYQTYFTGSSDSNYTYTGTGVGTACKQTHFSTGGGMPIYVGPVGNSDSRFYGTNLGNKNGVGIVVDETTERTDYLPSRFAKNRNNEMELGCEYSGYNHYCGYGAGVGWSESMHSDTNNDPYVYVPNYYGSSSNAGKGVCRTEMHVCFGNSYSWVDGKPYGFLLYFSTAGIVSDVVSIQFMMRGEVAGGSVPRYWCVEYALPESELVSDLDSLNWTSVGDFTLTDKQASSASNYKPWQLMAFKGINFNMPTAVLGQEHVYVRIRPTSDKCSMEGDYDYDGATYSGTNKVLLMYLGVRYNK